MIHLLREETDLSYPQIGKLLDRSHSTIVKVHQYYLSTLNPKPVKVEGVDVDKALNEALDKLIKEKPELYSFLKERKEDEPY